MMMIVMMMMMLMMMMMMMTRCPEGSSASELSSYDECIENALKGRGQKLQTQCTTDTLRNNDKLTVPLYTDHCSAICFTKGNTKGVHDCPYNGIRLDGRGTSGSEEVDAPIVDRFLG